jgi:hypothetical protein
LVGELFKSLAGTPEIVPVPYRGAGPVMADLISGQIPMGSVGLTTQVLELHRTAKLRVLAVTSPTRLGAPDFRPRPKPAYPARGEGLSGCSHRPGHRGRYIDQIVRQRTRHSQIEATSRH